MDVVKQRVVIECEVVGVKSMLCRVLCIVEDRDREEGDDCVEVDDWWMLGVEGCEGASEFLISRVFVVFDAFFV